MFQYAVGRRLAARHGVPLALDTRLLATDKLRSYALGGLKVSASFADPATLPHPPGPIARRLGWLPLWLKSRRRVLESTFNFDPTILDLSPPVHLSGNWQSERYFIDVSELIRSEFQLATPFSRDRAALAEVIAARNAVSVHVRRGDYVTNPTANAFHGTCPPRWYASARARMDAVIPAANYVLFSDDPDWSRANLPELADALFVEPSSDGKDEQDMHLMALCRHHIIANSSFSWWGAWLNPNSDKHVIAPKVWFSGASYDTSDLIPSTWQRL